MIDIEQVLRHPARCRVLLGLRSEGPMSPIELTKSRLGKGFRLEVYSYHFKELHRRGLVESVDADPADQQPVTRYTVPGQLSQSVLDAAALTAISEVLARAPERPADGVEATFIDEIADLVTASGRTLP